jgi:hypothetical protein
MTQATVGDIRSARKWVEALAAQYKGVRVAYLLWIRAGVETPTLNDAQREALEERQAELLWGGL